LASSKPPSSDVNSYSKLSKLQLIGKDNVEKTSSPISRTSSIEIVLTSRKRKVEDDTTSISKKLRRDPDAPRIEPATPVSRKRKIVRFAEPEAVPSTPTRTAPTPSSSRKRQFESDETTQAETLFERLALQSPVRKRTKAAVQNEFDLPQELIDLLDLHVAFLKALSMQCVHDGTNSPIDLRTLYPSVTRAWGKRQVSLGDIQRCIGVLSWTPVKSDNSQPKAPFFLADYGRGKVCIDFHPNAEPGPLPVSKLNMDFEANLRTLWLSRRDQATPLFLATLPKAALKSCHALAKVVGPTKTQTTLEEFKKTLPPKKQQNIIKPTTPAAPTNHQEETPKLTLLERIRAREAQRAQTAPGPSIAALERRAALHRAVDVAAVIGMLSKAALSSGQQAVAARVSFTMAAVLVRLKDSLRTPVSAEDGAACVRLLAAEVAPGWLRIVTIGGRENVIVQPGYQMGKGEVEERVRVLLG
jgi:hypothetical protein